MILAEKIETLDDEIKASKDQYDLDKKADKIFALSSGRLEKYYYLTGEDFGYKPEPIEKAKFGHSPLIQIFNKDLKNEGEKDKENKTFKTNSVILKYDQVITF